MNEASPIRLVFNAKVNVEQLTLALARGKPDQCARSLDGMVALADAPGQEKR